MSQDSGAALRGIRITVNLMCQERRRCWGLPLRCPANTMVRKRSFLSWIKEAAGTNSSSTFDARLALILFSFGTVTNLFGLVAAVAFSPPGFMRLLDGAITLVSLVACVAVAVVLFKKKLFNEYSVVISVVIGLVLFPFIFITSGGMGGTFIYYFFIIAVSMGFSVRKRYQLAYPFACLVSYDVLMYLSYRGMLPCGREYHYVKIVPLLIGFSSTWLFVFFSTRSCIHVLLEDRRLILEAERQYKELSAKDELTGLPNRRKLDEELSLRNFRYGIMFDIDYFKQINDTYGHQAGDKKLQELAAIFIRSSSNEFRFFRYGGEEFFALSRFEFDDTVKIMRSIFDDVRAEMCIDGRPITVSAGISGDLSGSLEMFVKEADANLYIAKHNGRDQCVFGGERLF